jgi:hypothetical protein
MSRALSTTNLKDLIEGTMALDAIEITLYIQGPLYVTYYLNSPGGGLHVLHKLHIVKGK